MLMKKTNSIIMTLSWVLINSLNKQERSEKLILITINCIVIWLDKYSSI